MAISPPGDLILDVVRAADPDRVAEAHRTMLAKGAAEKGAAFEVGVERKIGARREAAQETPIPDSYREFEALVLQTFLQSMWPKDSEATFGKGTAGDMWKGMMSEHLGRAMADSGGIGIARQLTEERARAAAGRPTEELTRLAEGLLDGIERSVLREAGSENDQTAELAEATGTSKQGAEV